MFHNPRRKTRVLESANQYQANTLSKEVMTMGEINHLIKAFTKSHSELKLMAAILLAQSSDQVRAVELLARLRLQLEQTLGCEAYAEAWQRGMRLDLDEALQALPLQFLEKEAYSKRETTSQSSMALSERELEVLRLMADGCSNKEIAKHLYIGVSTVKKHINHIYDKLDAKNRTQAVALARKRQLVIP
jgi:DNA-binding NarL/FixJ family response regulator